MAAHANWGKATCTGGSGNQTLSPILGWPTPYQCAGNQSFPYIALTASEQPLEAGWGRMIDSTTLQRERVVAIYDGSNVTQGASLTPSTLPNGAKIVCGAHAGSVQALMPTVDNTSGVGRFMTSAARSLATANCSPSSLRMHYLPFQIGAGTGIGSLAVNVVTAGATGAQAQMALYAITANGGVGDMLPGCSTSIFAVDTTGFKVSSLATPQFVPGGWCFVGFLYTASTTGLVLTGHASTGASMQGGSPLGFLGNNNSAIECRYEALGSFVLPTTPGTTTASVVATGIGPTPMIFMGVQ
jgi:hypothetical protein